MLPFQGMGRALLGALTLISITTASGTTRAHARAAALPARVPRNPIQMENALPGTSAWRITRPSAPCPDSSLPGSRPPCIEGYANLTSVNAGSPIAFFVNAVPATTYSLAVFRLGWYQGKGGRLLLQAPTLTATAQPACPVNPELRMVFCQWTRSYTRTVPSTWTSGVYLVLLTRADGVQSYISFVVRQDGRASAILFQSSVTTAQAYNYWGGRSLYHDKAFPDTDPRSFANRAYGVSFDRPTERGYGAGDVLFWEYPMVRWLERLGLDVTYQTDLDTDADGSLLLQHRAFLSVGHDEYWSQAMRDNVEHALRHGVSLGFFGANAAYWQVRFGSSVNGARRVMLCYKYDLKPVDTRDPLSGHQNSLVTIRWRDALTKPPSSPRVARPEQALIGQMSEGVVDAPGAALKVKNTGSWPFTGTGLHDGDAIPGMVGYEYDRVFPNAPMPAGEIVLADSPLTNTNGKASESNVTLYRAVGRGSVPGAWVFSAGTIQWSWGLDNDNINAGDVNRDKHQVADVRVQKLTSNVLHAFSQ